VNYREFLDKVQSLGCFASEEETQAVVAHVLRAMAEVLPQRQVEGLAASLPAEIMVYLRGAHEEPDPFFDSQLFLGWVVSSIDATGARDKTDGGLDLYAAYSGEEAIRRCQCVFSVLRSLLEPQQLDALAACLPDEVGGWFLGA
jgi:uncharacterized protein (DUF2267 family)